MRANHRRWLPTAYRFVLACAFALAFGAGSVLAQANATSADLCGFVRDPAGAVVSGATVTARNTSIERRAARRRPTTRASTSSSNFRRATYEVTVEAANFKKAVVPSVTLTVGQRADLDFALELGQITDVVTVTGAHDRADRDLEDQRLEHHRPGAHREPPDQPARLPRLRHDQLDRHARQRPPHRPRPDLRPQHRRPARALHPRAG